MTTCSSVRDEYARAARRSVADLLEQAAEVVRLGQLDQAVEALDLARELVVRLRDELAKPVRVGERGGDDDVGA